MSKVRKIKVLVADDSQFFRTLIIRGLSQDSSIEVVGEAVDAYDARDKIINLRPQVMVLDVQMPQMNGIDFLKKLLPQYPMPVVVISSTSGMVFDAMNAGAVDFVAKPEKGGSENLQNFINDLSFKIKIASTARIGSKIARESSSVVREAPVQPVLKNNAEKITRVDSVFNGIIAIGASTGGTEATYEILKKMPADCPGILVVQHMPPGFTRMYAERLNSTCRMEVREARNWDEVVGGLALIAPGGCQMKLQKRDNKFYVRIEEGEKVNGHCPSVDVLFGSVAETAAGNSIGVILTGMGADGAKGLLSMKNNGAFTLGQDEKSCVVYGMPKVAWELGAVDVQGNTDTLAEILLSKFNRSTRFDK